MQATHISLLLILKYFASCSGIAIVELEQA